MIDFQIKEERNIKIKIIAFFLGLSIATILVTNLVVIPYHEPICELNPEDYKDSPMDKAGVPMEKAKEDCKSLVVQARHFSFISLFIPILMIYLIFFTGRKLDKEHKEWFTNHNGKCGRCRSDVTWLDTWWNPDNKMPICERCAIATGLDQDKKSGKEKKE